MADTSGDAYNPGAEDRQELKTGVRGGSQPPITMTVGSEPPGSTLSFGGETVEAGIGTYCWTARGGGSCVDEVGISLGDEKLTIRSGEPMSFAYGGNELDSLDITAYEVGRKGSETNRIEDGVLVPPYRIVGKEEEPKVRRSGTRAQIVAELSAGEYVLDAFATMPQGDVSYGFRLMVEARETASGAAPAFATARFDPALPVDELRRMAAEHGVEAGRTRDRFREGTSGVLRRPWQRRGTDDARRPEGSSS